MFTEMTNDFMARIRASIACTIFTVRKFDAWNNEIYDKSAKTTTFVRRMYDVLCIDNISRTHIHLILLIIYFVDSCRNSAQNCR